MNTELTLYHHADCQISPLSLLLGLTLITAQPLFLPAHSACCSSRCLCLSPSFKTGMQEGREERGAEQGASLRQGRGAGTPAPGARALAQLQQLPPKKPSAPSLCSEVQEGPWPGRRTLGALPAGWKLRAGEPRASLAWPRRVCSQAPRPRRAAGRAAEGTAPWPCPQSAALGTPASSRGGFSPREELEWSACSSHTRGPAGARPKAKGGCRQGKRRALAAAGAPQPQAPPLQSSNSDRGRRIYKYNIFHYEIAISFPAFYLVHPELGASFLRHTRGLGSFLRRGTCPPRHPCQGQEAGPRSSRPAPHFPLHQGRPRLLAAGACRGAYSSLRLPSADSSPSFARPAVAAARKQQLKPSTSRTGVQTVQRKGRGRGSAARTQR